MKHPYRLIAMMLMIALFAPSAFALDRTLFVINALAETLSRVNLPSDAVTNNVAVLGLAPNQIFIDNVRRRDTVAYVTNSTSSDVQMINLNTSASLGSILLGPGRNPWSLEFLDDSIVAVTNLLTNTLSEVDTRHGVVRSEYPVGQAPEGLALHNGLLYVCLTGFDFGTFTYGQGQIAVVDPNANAVIDTINVGKNPQSVLVDYDKEILVLCTGDFSSVLGQIYVIDPATNSVTDSIGTGGSPGSMALSPNRKVYIAAGGFGSAGEVYVFDSKTNAMIHDASNPVSVGTGAVAVATDLEGFAYSCDFSVDRVSKINQDDSVVLTYNLGDGPGSAAVYEPFPAGDVNETGDVTTADGIFLVNYVFRGGPAPNLRALGDVNRSCAITTGDIVSIINYVLRSGPRLAYGCY
jgi:YVTN family beta-propeller protein